MASRPAEARHLRLVKGGRAAPAETVGAGALGPTAELEDKQLVALARSGDMQAFETLYRRHAGFATNLAVRIQGSSADVEDVVHDAFLRAHARLADLRESSAFRGWLGSIVVRLVHSRLRRRRLLASLGIAHTGEPVDLDALASESASPEIRAQLAQLYALLKTLSPPDRIAWTLRHVERHNLEEVAMLCDCSLATAKRRIQRAARFLQEHFVPAEATHEPV